MSDLSRIPPPCEPTGRYLVASYAHADRDVVYPILERFLSLGARIWYDAGINLSSDWTDSIGDAIKACSAFVVFITPRSVASKNVKNEIAFAAETDRQLLAIHLEETELPAGIALTLNSRQALHEWQKPKDVIYRELTAFVTQYLAAKPSPTPRDLRLCFQSTVDLTHRESGMAISPDGSSLLVVGDKHSTIFYPRTGEAVLQITNATYGRPLAFSPDGTMLATISNETHIPPPKGRPVRAEHKSIVRLLHLPDLTEVYRLSHDHFMYALNFSSDGTLLALGFGNFSAERFREDKSLTFVLIVRADTGAEVHRIPLAFNPWGDLAFSPDGTLMALAANHGNVSVVQTDTGHEKYRLTDPALGSHISFNPDGTLLAINGPHEPHSLSVLNTRSGEWAYRINVLRTQGDQHKNGGGIGGMAFSPDGALIATWGGTYLIGPTWIPHRKKPKKRILNPDRKKSVDMASIHQARTGALLWNFDDDLRGTGMPASFSPDSSLLAFAAKDSIRVCDAQTGTTICRLGYGEGILGSAVNPQAISFNHDGSLLAVAGHTPTKGFVMAAELIDARS